VSHPVLAGYPKYLDENPHEKEAEYFIEETHEDGDKILITSRGKKIIKAGSSGG
jgi:hypothetical protein